MAEPETKSQSGSMEKGSDIQDQVHEAGSSEIDLLEYHEHNAGRLVIDPEYVHWLLCCTIHLTLCMTEKHASSSARR